MTKAKKISKLGSCFSRWNGVVGYTLYGVADIGLCNVDITHVRYQAIDYSAYNK